MSNIITCEQVSNGHPDKICDQIADAVVTRCLRGDPFSRVAIEVLIKDNHIIIAGELTSDYEPNYRALVDEVFDRIGKDRLGYDVENLDLQILVSRQSGDIAQGVDVGGAGDQGMMFGYATNETPELLPMPFVLATRFLEKLKGLDRHFRADAKAQVSFDYDDWKITTFLCSVQHTEDADPAYIKKTIGRLMKKTAAEAGLNTDFEILVNPTGRFVLGGPYADSGVTGRKLACDTYGGVGHIGGGALSGKDPTKVDRSGAYIARKIARDIVRAGFAEKCEVQIAYAIGVAEPVSVHVETFGTESQEVGFIEDYIRGNYDLTPKGIIEALHLIDFDYNEVSSYGHFGKIGPLWEA
jgi:S-adenosylmethionine synthetase